nr:putative ribonuclease H-like domain-containing protein [Tanacetum cinerariifolium]
MNYQPVTACNQSNPSAGVQEQFDAEKTGEENVQNYVLFPVWSSGSTNPQNTDGDASFDEKEPKFEGRKSESEVNVSSSSSAQSNAASPSNAAVSPTHGKSSYVDSSQLPDDLNMPEFEDITYSDDEDEDDVGFMVYQMDVKSAFLYGTIEEEVHVYQPLGFQDPDYPNKVYKVVKALYGLHQAPRAWYETFANYLLENGFQKGKIDQTLFIKRQKDGKSASTPIDTKKPLLKDPDGEDKVNDVTRLQALVDKKKVVITEATIRDALRLDDAEGIDCLLNEEIFAELARMGYEKPLTKLTFYKAFFSSQWKFLIHTILQCMSAKRTSWNVFSSSMASAVICLSTGDYAYTYACLDGSMVWISKDLKTQFTFTFDQKFYYMQ